jgi:ABC-type branched-subunit amino acid transport system ATPase component
VDTLLDVVDVHRSFAGLRAVDGASLAVRRGSITGLIGPNGAGKSTLFNIIAGTLRPECGRVVFDGTDVTNWSTDRRARAGLVRTFQLSRGLPSLTVLENLMLYAPDQPGEAVRRSLLPSSAARRRERAVLADAEQMAAQLKLGHVSGEVAADLSGGQKKLLDLGRVLMTRPRLLLLDEPMAGVNPPLARDLADHLLRIRDQGITILVIEHNMGFVGRICDHLFVLAAGRTLAEGNFADICRDHQVQSAYLGSAA